MSEEIVRDHYTKCAMTCIMFLNECGVDPEDVNVNQMVEVIDIYCRYGEQGVRDYLSMGNPDDGGILAY